MLESLITSTGFRRHVLQYDTQATINRINLTLNVHEMDELDRDQLIMMLTICRDAPGSPRWNYVEMRYGPIVTGTPRNTE